MRKEQQSKTETKTQLKGGRRNACTKTKWRGCRQEYLQERMSTGVSAGMGDDGKGAFKRIK